VKGVGGLSLILSEAPVVIVVAMVSAIVSPCVVVGKGCQRIRVLWYQSIGVHCKDTGTVVCEFQLLLDFKTF
jgi:hypothetical protein